MVNAGEDERFEAIRPVLLRAVSAVCPRWLSDRRDDIVQIAMAHLCDMQRRSGETAQLGPSYLRRVAYTAVVDEIRRLRARPDIRSAEDVEEAAGIELETPNPESRYRGREAGDAIQACLGGLIPSRRAAVTLRLLGHSVPEISKMLGWTRKKTENLVQRGLIDLRQCLRDKGFEP
jgi:RNA polymerase sigma-70 factor (ECF subfamily)